LPKETAVSSSKLALKGGESTVPEGMIQYWPWVTPEDREAMIRVIDSGRYWLGTTPPHGPEIHGLEREWAEYVGAEYCIAVSSGTSAIHTAVVAAGIGPGDEVIVPAYTYIASASPVLYHNGIPIFVDVDPETYNIDPAKIEEAITEKTRAIVAVDLNGLPADYDPIRAIAAKHGLKIIEDGSQAQGATYNGVRVGNLGDVAGVSLNGGKNLSGGEGGLFTTNDEEAFDRAHKLHQCGEVAKPGEPWQRRYVALGWNYRYNEVMAAFVRSELRRLDSMNETRRRNCAFLEEYLGDIPVLALQKTPANCTHVYFYFSGCLQPEAAGLRVDRRRFRDTAVAALQAEGVPMMSGEGVSGPMPLPGHTVFQARDAYGRGCPWSCPHARQGIEYHPEDYPVSMRIVESKISLGHEHGGLAPPNGLELMEHYVQAFRKVLVEHLEEVAALAAGSAQEE
jgi:perosamine synthetase